MACQGGHLAPHPRHCIPNIAAAGMVLQTGIAALFPPTFSGQFSPPEWGSSDALHPPFPVHRLAGVSMALSPLLPRLLLPCSLIHAQFWRRFSSLHPSVVASPDATIPGVIHRWSSSQLRASKPIVGGLSNRPHWSLFSRVSHIFRLHPVGRNGPSAVPGGRNRGARLFVARWALLRCGIGRSCYWKAAGRKAACSPGRKARAEQGSEPNG